MCTSEVAQIRQRIQQEYEAMKQGLEGLALGTSKHAFIEARMRRVDSYYAQLKKDIGEQEAGQTVYDLYTRTWG